MEKDKIYRLFLRNGARFTRQQVALATGDSYSSVKSVYIPKLKRSLVLKEENGVLYLNPDL